MKTVITIPVYKNELSCTEKLSLKNITKLLKENVVFVGPNSIRKSSYIKENPQIKFIDFNEKYFSSIKTYDTLVLSPSFYRFFANLGYDWLLIFQLDAFLFKSDFTKFLNTPYDYFGAPWLNGQTVSNYFTKGKLLRAFGKRIYVGNGGVSLRRISSTIRLLEEKNKAAANWKFNEDAFFGYYGKKVSFFKACTFELAREFAFERDCDELYRQNKKKLPFACHAFEKYDHNFYKKHIPGLSEIIT